jgi:uncharacterized protein YndB with AHSA1/START domain
MTIAIRRESTVPTNPTKRRPITIERTFPAPPEEVWEMWTTKEGLESWWGPERFVSTVRVLELRPGGRLEIEMRTDDPEVVAYLKSAGQSTSSVEKITFTEIEPTTRLAFMDRFDHAPDVEPYDIACVVTLEAVPGGTRMRLTSEGMHDERWTELATAGWSSSFDKLAKALEGAVDRTTAAQ